MTLPTVRRPLSPVERWYWIADQVSPLNVIARVRVIGRLERDLLRAALDALQVRHPLLRVAITVGPDGAGPAFVPRQTLIPLRQVRGERWLDQINDRELVERIDSQAGPLCRTVVLTRPGTTSDTDVHDLILTLPHCIADGTTVLSLLKEWLLIAAGLESTSDNVLPVEPALPASEELFPPAHRGTAGALVLGRQRARDERALHRHQPARVEPTEFVPFAERRTRMMHRWLTAGQVETLLGACRRERTTVHGVLAAAMVAAVAAEAPGTDSVAIGSPINFRAELVPPVPNHAVGSYVATVPTYVRTRTGGALWPMARSISRDLVRRKRRGEPFAMVNLVGGSCPMSVAEAGPLIEFMETSGPVNLCISNIGRYEFPADIGRWRCSGAQFVAGLSVCGYFVSTVNTSHDRLSWNFCHVEGGLSRVRAERLVTASVDAVLAVIAGER
jgi:hypothetical protein